jgi:hypothetical protein
MRVSKDCREGIIKDDTHMREVDSQSEVQRLRKWSSDEHQSVDSREFVEMCEDVWHALSVHEEICLLT